MVNPDLILHNGNIYPRADGTKRVQAVAVWNGQVIALGTDTDILRLKARLVRLIDLKRRTVLPGFSDSHIHLMGYGLTMKSIRLYYASSIKQVQDAVARASQKGDEKSWLLGRGWDQEKLREHRYLNKRDLDGITNRPVFLRRVCGHIGVANSVALSEAGVSRASQSPEGGEIVFDRETGEPTGLLKEKAMQLVEDKIRYDEKAIADSLVKASKHLLRLGLTSLHCIIQNAQELHILRRLSQEGRVKQLVYAIIPAQLLDESIKVGLLTELDGGSHCRIGGVKIFMDGSLGARTAALNEPYSDEASNMGILTFSEEQLREVIVKAESAGFQLCMHAIGDRALGTIVDVMERTSNPLARKRLRHRVEHCSVAPPTLTIRMRRLGLIGSVQPRFIHSDRWIRDRLGDRRLRNAYPFHRMLEKGIVLAAGSDGPVEDPNPMEGVWSAVTRPGLLEEDALTVGEALNAYTLGAAYASHSEKHAGTIELGKRADMVVLDRDPFAIDPADLRRAKVVMTIIGGEVVFGG